LSFLGALEAEFGRIDDAAKSLETAGERLEDRLLMAMHTLNRCHLELARASDHGKTPGAAIRAVEERISLYERPGSGGWTGRDADKNVIQSSMDVRLALRLLRSDLSARTRAVPS